MQSFRVFQFGRYHKGTILGGFLIFSQYFNQNFIKIITHFHALEIMCFQLKHFCDELENCFDKTFRNILFRIPI